MSDIQTLRRSVEQLKGRKAQIVQNITTTKQSLREKSRDLCHHDQAREIIRHVGQKTQEQLCFHISDITSLALEAVFDNPYKLVTEFVQRRNKTECDLHFERDGEKVNPMDASGGGAVDVASFALRVASWSMQRPKSRSVLVMDEPFKNLSTGLLPRASQMLKQISSELGLQIIMVTHLEELMEEADKVFKVSIKRGITSVREEC